MNLYYILKLFIVGISLLTRYCVCVCVCLYFVFGISSASRKTRWVLNSQAQAIFLGTQFYVFKHRARLSEVDKKLVLLQHEIVKLYFGIGCRKGLRNMRNKKFHPRINGIMS